MTDAMITALMELIFQNENMAGIGDATGLRGSVADGNFYFSLYSKNPRNYPEDELDYTGYARQPLSRDTSGFSVSGTTASNQSLIQFPNNTGEDTQTATYFGIHTASSGGSLFASAPLASQITVAPGPVTTIETGQIVIEFERL